MPAVIMLFSYLTFGFIFVTALNQIHLSIQQAQIHTNRRFYQKKPDIRQSGAGSSRAKRMEALIAPGEIWPNARVPYELSTAYTPNERAFIARGFSEFERRTCVRFVPRTAADKDYIFIGKIDECSSELGKLGGRQELSLDSDCATDYPSIIHETMHALGFLHEHQRNDRDTYVRILWQNIIPPDRAADYYKASQSDPDLQFSNYGEPYDYFSIMHYSRDEDNENGQNVIEALIPGYTALIGMGSDFSQSDITQINRMYKCPQAG